MFQLKKVVNRKQKDIAENNTHPYNNPDDLKNSDVPILLSF